MQVPTVIVTAGGDGVAWALRDGKNGAIPALPVTVISTHGAGDMFIGTFCLGIAQGAMVEIALQQANAAAARHISTPHTIT